MREKAKAVAIIRQRAKQSNLRDMSKQQGMSDGYFQDAVGRNGERVHNAVIRVPEWFPPEIVKWAKEESARRYKQSMELREQNRKLRARSPVMRQSRYVIDAHNYPSPHPQKRYRQRAGTSL